MRLLRSTVTSLTLIGWLFLGAPLLRAEAGRGSLQLTIPPVCHAVAGQRFQIVFENLVLTEKPAEVRYDVQCDVGTAMADRWLLEAKAGDVGRHRWSVTARNSAGELLGKGECEIQVAAADAGSDQSLRMLIVGDSLTHATLYPNELARRFSDPGNPKWTMIGTHKPASALAGVAHEGYGGWTWERFNTLYTATPDPAKTTRQVSPFVFADGDGKPGLDVARYLREHSPDGPPDVVVFLLGINDCFGAKPDDPAAMDAHIDRTFKQADILLAEFHRAAPKARLAVCLTPPPNTRDGAFEANYMGRYPRWGWRRIQHRLVQKQLEHFGGRTEEKIFVVPTGPNVDPTAGYPENNGVHPNDLGYRQIAASIYAWWKCTAAK